MIHTITTKRYEEYPADGCEVFLDGLIIGCVEYSEDTGRWLALVGNDAQTDDEFDEKSEAVQYLAKVHYESADEIIHWEIRL